MQCEMCGETIRGIPKLIRVEGAELQVCSRCGKFGTEVTAAPADGYTADGCPARPGGPGSGGNGSSTAETGHVRLHGR